MAMILTVSQPQLAQFGRPTTFVVGIQNTGGSPVAITSLAPVVKSFGGSVANTANVGPITFAVGATSTVSASSTLYVSFEATFFGSGVNGAQSAASNQYLLSVDGYFDDDSTSSSVAIPVSVASPVWGLNPGTPPNADVTITSMQLYTPPNSAMALFA